MISLAGATVADSGPPEPRVRRAGALVGQHGRALLEVTIVSGLGIVASAGFQVVATRGLGPEGFGLLAAFLAVINIAAIGSAALRNSVAVQVATFPVHRSVIGQRRPDASLIEALVLGAVFSAGLFVASPWLAGSLQSNGAALLLAVGTIIPYFLFARSLGLLQGSGATRDVVWWSTGAQLVQLALAVVVLALGFGAIGILAIFLATIVIASLGSSVQTRQLALNPSTRPFSANSVVVVLLTISFAWLTNVDVILVRSGATELTAGTYAAAAVLVKTTLVLPATLSLYLLPRFVTNRANSRMTRLGVSLSLGVTLASGLLIAGVLTVAGPLIVAVLFGQGYELTVALLPVLALMWVPWAMVQAILVRITSISSRWGLALLVVAIVVQWVGANLLLPDVYAMMILNGSIGVVVLASLFTIHHLSARKSDADAAASAVS
jgi:O-antigen/teichoic acid export membrane protein